jgi:recombination protein RecA
MSSLALNTSYTPLPVSFLEKKAVVLKHIAQSERLVAVRPASHLEVRPRPEMVSTGIVQLDALTGGIPRGCLTEVCGRPSSGKSSMLLATMASVTRQGEFCVLIDASDSFDPSSGAAAGVEFSKLLWVRCGKSSPVFGGRALAKNDQTTAPHPSAFFAEGGATHDSQQIISKNVLANQRPTASDSLEHVLKSTDLILQSGGFGLVVLDLAGIPDKFVRRIPLASWFRFQRAVEHTKTALMVVSEIVCAQTCAALVMKLSAVIDQPPAKPSHARLLKEMHIEAEIMRSRLERKPMQSVKTTFSAQALRAG